MFGVYFRFLDKQLESFTLFNDFVNEFFLSQQNVLHHVSETFIKSTSKNFSQRFLKHFSTPNLNHPPILFAWAVILITRPLPTFLFQHQLSSFFIYLFIFWELSVFLLPLFSPPPTRFLKTLSLKNVSK